MPGDDTIVEATNAQALANNDAIEVTALAGRYRLEGLLGRGGMGSVYTAHDLELQEKVALKLLRLDTKSKSSADELRAEVRIARKVTHANVARTYDLGLHEGRHFLTMELVDGPSLRVLLQSVDLARLERLSLVEQIAAGLAAVHEQNILHRDLKPDNILVTRGGVAKITDFGIALVADAVPSDGAGTPGYMAPELLRGEAPTFASDVFALGRVAYEVLKTGDINNNARKDVSTLEPAVRSIITRTLDEDPTRRPTAKDVKHVIAKIIEGESEAAPVTVSVPHRKQEQRSGRTLLRVGVAAFSTDGGGDAYLGTSLAADALRVLVGVPELEVTNFILPSSQTAIEEARASNLRAIVMGAVRRTRSGSEGDNVTVTIRLVAVDDALQIWARNFTTSFDRVLAELAEAVLALTKALDVHERPTLRALRADAHVVELYLRASEAEHRPWSDWGSDAAEFFAKALERAPDDSILLAGLALSLLRGGPPYTRERYLRGRDAADRSVLHSNTRNGTAQLACAASLLVANEGRGAVEALRRTLSVAPSLADAHAMLAAIAGDVGLLDESIARARLTLALDPRILIARFVAGRALEMKGDRAACDALLLEGLMGPPTFGQYLCALSIARFALWRGTPEDKAKARARLEPHAQHPLIQPLIGVLEEVATPAERVARVECVLQAMTPLRSSSAEWARQRALACELEAELLLSIQADDRAIGAVAGVSETGTFDAAWFATCPLLSRIADASVVQHARRTVNERALIVKDALWSLSDGRR